MAIFIAMGIVSILLGVCYHAYLYDIVKNGIKTTAVVERLIESEDGNEPLFLYQVNGKNYWKKWHIGFVRGESITIIYHKDKPHRIVVPEGLSQLYLSLLAYGCGALIIAFAIIILFLDGGTV